MKNLEARIAAAAEAIAHATHAFALTGAGISVESGIPDFRSAGGIWSKYPPRGIRHPRRLSGESRQGLADVEGTRGDLGAAAPDPAHFALARLEALGKLHAIVTQNVDNLHQRAGSQKVIEYHGNGGRTYCMKCHRRAALDLAALGEGAPHCACGGLLKPDVVLFGELIPTHSLFDAEGLAQCADLVLIVGTSAQVYPAAGLPCTAKQHGALIVECNTEATDFTEEVTDFFLPGKAGEILPASRPRWKDRAAR